VKINGEKRLEKPRQDKTAVEEYHLAEEEWRTSMMKKLGENER
jgi:hypothetical protein